MDTGKIDCFIYEFNYVDFKSNEIYESYLKKYKFDIILQQLNDYYTDPDVLKYLNMNLLTNKSMYILPKQLFIQYRRFLTDSLFYLFKQNNINYPIDIEKFSKDWVNPFNSYSYRYFAYVLEFLSNVWVHANCKHITIPFWANNPERQSLSISQYYNPWNNEDREKWLAFVNDTSKHCIY